jgi:catechol 2,3-dioxygenase-like lactoylglutathione lyase family enzyme
MAADPTSRELSRAWQGIDHVTLVTPDLDATVAFYRDVLEMAILFEAPANPFHGRHAMISPGGPGMGFHFFEVSNAQVFRLSGPVPTKPGEFLAGALQHLAITLTDERAALSLRERLAARAVPVTPVIEPGRFAPAIRMFLFPDPSGLLLKAVWNHADNS